MKYLIGIIALLLSQVAVADTRSDQVLKALSDKMEEQGAYSVEFSVDAGPRVPITPGRFVVSGNKYYINVSGMEVFFDGQTRQTFSSINNEVVVERSLPESESLLSNPTNIFKLYDTDFEHNVTKETDSELVIEMSSLDENFGSMTVYVSKLSGLISTVEMHFEDMDFVFTIDNVEFGINPSQSTFSFDRSAHKNVEVIEY